MTDEEIIKCLQGPGKFDTKVQSEADALRIVRLALPHAVELPPAIAGKSYPAPPAGAKAWFQVHPPDAASGSGLPNLPHVKYVDWTRGKRKKGGSWGHVFFPSEEE